MALFYRKRPMSISVLCSSPGRFAPESRNFPGDESSGVKHTGPGAEWARFPAPQPPLVRTLTPRTVTSRNGPLTLASPSCWSTEVIQRETKPGLCPQGSQDSGRGKGITGRFQVVAGRWGEVGSRQEPKTPLETLATFPRGGISAETTLL